eukprot:9208310-Pyramimonas_sp.AAC.2
MATDASNCVYDVAIGSGYFGCVFLGRGHAGGPAGRGFSRRGGPRTERRAAGRERQSEVWGGPWVQASPL